MAIYVGEGEEAFPREIIHQPSWLMYKEGFGSEYSDTGVVATINIEIVGMAWVRIMDDYGHINDETPSLTVSLSEAYRNQGLGTKILKKLFVMLVDKGFKHVSLSIQVANGGATHLYHKLGFETFQDNKDELIMILDLAKYK